MQELNSKKSITPGFPAPGSRITPPLRPLPMGDICRSCPKQSVFPVLAVLFHHAWWKLISQSDVARSKETGRKAGLDTPRGVGTMERRPSQFRPVLAGFWPVLSGYWPVLSVFVRIFPLMAGQARSRSCFRWGLERRVKKFRFFHLTRKSLTKRASGFEKKTWNTNLR